MGGGPAPRIGLNLKVAQKQILTPGLVQMVSVLALNKLELREMINREMVANPFWKRFRRTFRASTRLTNVPKRKTPNTLRRLTIMWWPETTTTRIPSKRLISVHSSMITSIPDTGLRRLRWLNGPPSRTSFLSQRRWSAHLDWQLSLCVCSDSVREAGHSIIGNLNEDGYVTAPLEEIAQTGGHSLADVQEALSLIQVFDPVGVAARDVRECLLIQLHTLAPENTLAQQIVSGYLKQLQNKQYRDIARALDRPVKTVERCVELIRKLDPRPGQRYNNAQARLIEPDVAFVKAGDTYQVIMNEDGLPQLRLSHHYRRLLGEDSTTREVRNYVKERFTSAIQLIKNIEQRKQTIVRVCEAIIRRQNEFLDRGIDYLRPMMIKEVAEEVGVHPSTVSRAVANKYAYTPQGVYELRYFFSEAVQGPSGAATSLINLKRLVKKMIEEEDAAHPLTDDQITQQLQKVGYCVTRRTVAKYREDMRIPSTHQRRVKA